mmetsp:Transcript_63086/g.163042  ORF Transcript_63086/g.163042 Transcript_63086/m.163042 type:complete len:209 (-) Transcript_63086:25-651(-)
MIEHRVASMQHDEQPAHLAEVLGDPLRIVLEGAACCHLFHPTCFGRLVQDEPNMLCRKGVVERTDPMTAIQEILHYPANAELRSTSQLGHGIVLFPPIIQNNPECDGNEDAEVQQRHQILRHALATLQGRQPDRHHQRHHQDGQALDDLEDGSPAMRHALRHDLEEQVAKRANRHCVLLHLEVLVNDLPLEPGNAAGVSQVGFSNVVR